MYPPTSLLASFEGVRHAQVPGQRALETDASRCTRRLQPWV